MRSTATYDDDPTVDLRRPLHPLDDVKAEVHGGVEVERCLKVNVRVIVKVKRIASRSANRLKLTSLRLSERH